MSSKIAHKNDQQENQQRRAVLKGSRQAEKACLPEVYQPLVYVLRITNINGLEKIRRIAAAKNMRNTVTQALFKVCNTANQCGRRVSVKQLKRQAGNFQAAARLPWLMYNIWVDATRAAIVDGAKIAAGIVAHPQSVN